MKTKYWEDRANKRMESYHKNSDATILKINKAYDGAMQDINKDINNIVNNFKLNGDLNQREVRSLLNSKIPNPILKLAKKAIPKIKNEDIKQWLISRVNAKAYRARITRLEALKESIYINSKIIADVELTQSNLGYINSIKTAYYRNIFDIQKGIGIAFDFATMPVSTIEEILKNKWIGKHYSERVWHNTDILSEKLEEAIIKGLMAGNNSIRIAKELEGITNLGKYAAERLIRTETTYVTNMAELESYKQSGIEQYVFLATLDVKTSKQCREHDGKIYEVAKGVPGENLPPLHVWCRSTTIAYFGEETLDNMQRRARDPETGKNYSISNMSYEEWYKQHVVDKYGEQKAETFQKMIENKSSDKKQYNKYKEILGKEVPKTLKDFQGLKYNNSNGMVSLKQEYKEQNVRNYIKSDGVVKTILEGKQGKHIIGHNNYIEGRSYLTISMKEAQELINMYAGKDEIRFNAKGEWDKKEVITVDKDVGVDINNKTGEKTSTNRFKIHYSDKGTHIVPMRRE